MAKQTTCLVTGETRLLTPEEEVRQGFVRTLLDAGYRRENMVLNYKIKVGASSRFLDIAVFAPGSRLRQEDIQLIVETKRQGVSAKLWAGALDQLEVYLSCAPNAAVGVVTDGDRTQTIRKGYYKNMGVRSAWTFIDLPSVPRAGVEHPMTMVAGRAEPMRPPAPPRPRGTLEQVYAAGPAFWLLLTGVVGSMLAFGVALSSCFGAP